MAVKAEIVLDSISLDGIRLFTIAGECHRYIWSQILTHQNGVVRNSASSRAVPVNRNIKKVLSDPAVPIFWGKNRPGMGADEEIEGVEEAKRLWFLARDNAVCTAQQLLDLGVAKEVANRVLEPFLWQQCAITFTQAGWNNFANLRVHHAAQKEVQVFAKACQQAIDFSTPKQLGYREWHTPFLREEDFSMPLWKQKMVSTARTARVSYENHFGIRDVESDLKLFHQLFDEKPEHASPGGHICTPCRGHWGRERGTQHLGGLVGWDQFRHEMENNYDYN